jgi:AraC-like DNA-binding protein
MTAIALINPWEMALRGGVAGLLLFHLVHLAVHRARPAARAALALFTVALLAYLVCQRAELLLPLPRALAYGIVTLCVATSGWLWLAARALFDDHFRFTPALLGAVLALTLLGLTANLPYFPPAGDTFLSFAPDSAVAWLGRAHALAMLGFSAATLWEIARGWRTDLVEPRRAARRWLAMGVGLYAAFALAVELAVRGQPAGQALAALHVAGIGAISLALAVLVARGSLDAVLGTVPVPAMGTAAPQPTPAPATDGVGVGAGPEPAAATPVASPALAGLLQAMERDRLYRREGLALADLAAHLKLGEAAARALINQQLGYRNFNDFLHHYRLQEAAQRLVSDELPVLSIALDCGYGSIGPFNRAFKQRFGVTPSEYRGARRLKAGQTGAG